MFVREQAHGLRAPRVDADDMLHAVSEVCDHTAAARKGRRCVAAVARVDTDQAARYSRNTLCMVLTWIDYAVIAAYLLAITAFGSWFARFQKTTRDYFLTGRSVPWWAICFTIVATETSTLSFIGVPAGAYAGNMTFLQLALGYVVGRLLVSVLFIPAYFRGELFTSYELLQRRFGPQVKNVAAVIFLITRTLADGIRLFATALVISVVTQVPVTWTVIVARRRDDRLHRARRRVRGHLDRRRADVRLHRGARWLVFVGLLYADSGRLGRGRADGRRQRPVPRLRLQHRPDAHLHVLGRPARRHRADARDARHRSVPGPAPALGAIRRAAPRPA